MRLVCAALLFCGVLFGQDDAKKDDVILPDGPGKAEVLKICSKCHDLGVTTQPRLTTEGWQKKVQKMISRGAEGTDDEFDAIVAYMAKQYGKAQ